MAAYQDEDLFNAVSSHHDQFSHVTSTQGAFAFNQSFERPLIEEEKTGACVSAWSLSSHPCSTKHPALATEDGGSSPPLRANFAELITHS